MSLNLDTRQRAMLHEMGVHVWLPDASDVAFEPVDKATENIAVSAEYTRDSSQKVIDKPNAVQSPVSATPQASTSVSRPAAPPVRVLTPTPSPTTVTALPAGIADMSWPALLEAVSQCQACAMCLGRRASVLAAPSVSVPCDWLVLGDPPDEMEERAGQPFVDAAGQLLDNMLRAVGVQRVLSEMLDAGVEGAAKRAYLSHVLKCRPALARAPSADELAICSHYLRREIALTQPKVILAMGRFAMHLLLSETPAEQAKQPLGKLRGQVWRFAGVPVVVTYPPAYLLRSGQDKGKAWADLCLALDVAQGQLPAHD